MPGNENFVHIDTTRPVDEIYTRYTLNFRLRGGFTGTIAIGEKCRDWIRHFLLDCRIRDSFIVLDAEDKLTVALNSRHILYANLLFDHGVVKGSGPKIKKQYEIDVVFSDSDEVHSFGVDPDQEEMTEQSEWPDIQLQHMMFVLKVAYKDDEIMHLRRLQNSHFYSCQCRLDQKSSHRNMVTQMLRSWMRPSREQRKKFARLAK